MKLNKMGKIKNKKIHRKLPLKFRLIAAFLGFTVIMLVVLWLFQTVFLDDFYKVIKTRQLEKTTDYICHNIESEDITDYIQNIKERNDMSVGVYDTSSEIFRRVYTSDEPGSFGMEFMPHEVYACYEKARREGGSAIIDNEEAFFEEDIFSENKGEMPNFERSENDFLTCAEIIKFDKTEYMVMIRTEIMPVDSTIDTLKIQLLIVTIFLGVVGVVFAVVVSAKISKPLAKTNKAAKELANQNYTVSFDDEGYREIRELNATLNFAANELSAVDRLRRELISNISHDLRTPLTMISGYAEVMRDIPGENSPENLQVVIDETQRLSQLVTDLLDLSKLESGNIPMSIQRFCLTDSIRSIFTRYTKLISHDNYNITFEPDCDVFVMGDEIRLSQVIYNLINNAINYSGSDKAVAVKQIVDENVVRIEVSDNGEGIAPEDLKNIWDRYYRVDKEHKSAVIGTGLGLSIAKNVLVLHNARFGVKSTVGAGSTFWFELPVSKEV